MLNTQRMDLNEELNLVILDGVELKDRPIGVKIGPKSHLFAHAAAPGLDGAENPADTVSSPRVNEVVFYREYDSLPFRRLINQSADVFIENQRRSNDSIMSKQEALHYSRSYRSVLRSIIADLKQNSDEMNNMNGESEEILRMLVYNESVLYISEIIFIQQPIGGELIIQLLSWIRSYHNDVDINLEDIIESYDPSSHPEYYNTMKNCVLQGRIADCINLLKSANDSSQSYTTLIKILEKLPQLNTTGSIAVDYKIQFSNWNSELKQIINSSMFQDVPELHSIVLMLCGDDSEILSAVKSLCLPWYSYLLAVILYTQPTSTLNQINNIIDSSIEKYGGIEQLHYMEQVILSAISKDVISLLKLTCSEQSNWWLSVHLSDIFYQTGALNEKNSNDLTIRDGLLLEYSSSLLENTSLWSIGVRYLTHCDCPESRGYLSEYLTRISIRSTQEAMKVINICQQHGFTQQVTSICKILAMRDIKEDRLGSALTWCRHSKDSRLSSAIAERLLDQFNKHGLPDNYQHFIDALGNTVLISHQLMFLSKWREFQDLYQSNKEREAATLITNLLTSRIPPKRFWLMLLMETLPLLECRQTYFTSDQIYDLINCLSELRTESSQPADDNRMSVVQEVLTRVLSRCIILENNLSGIPGSTQTTHTSI